MNMKDDPAREMLEEMLNEIEPAVYAFNKNRRILWANASAQRINLAKPGGKLGVAEKDHLEDNKYFDESGIEVQIPGPKGSMIDRAFLGEATRDLVLEHRNLKYGVHRWLKVSCIPVMKDGKFDYGIIVQRDISATKNKENKLRFLVEAEKVLTLQTDLKDRLRRKAELIVPSLADWCAIDIKHPDGRIERVVLIHRDPSRVAWLEEFDLAVEKPGGERLSEIVIRTGAPIFMQRINPEGIEVKASFTELQIERIRKMQLSSSIIMPIATGKEVLGSLAISYAESKRQYSEEDFVFFREFCAYLGVLLENERLYFEIRERDRAKDMFLASLSHELRNPLAPIKSSLELIQLKGPKKDIKEEINVIEHQFDHMARLLNDLLDTSRLSQGKIQLEMTSFDVSEAAKTVLRTFTSLAYDAGINLTANYPEQPLTVFADRTRIEQTIANLLNNALKFTPRDGSIRLSIASDANTAMITVKDTGQGITEEEMRHIFEPYYQSERLRSTNSGLGVGLNLVQKIMQLHGGKVSAVSEALNKGSEFTLCLPLTSNVRVAEKDHHPV